MCSAAAILPICFSSFWSFNGVESAMAKGDIPRNKKTAQFNRHHITQSVQAVATLTFQNSISNTGSGFQLIFILTKSSFWLNREGFPSIGALIQSSWRLFCLRFECFYCSGRWMQCTHGGVPCTVASVSFLLLFSASPLPRMPCWWIGLVQVIYFYKIGNDISCFGFIFLSNGRPYIICYLTLHRQALRHTKAHWNTQTQTRIGQGEEN